MKRKITIALLALLGVAVVSFGWLWFAPCGMGGCAPVSELEKFQSEGSQLMDMNGRQFATLGAGSRTTVKVDSLPKYLPQAFLAVEDRRFYEHGGVDWKRFGGALFKNVKSGGVEEGGSTITMQLARNLFPKALPYRERSLRRKLMEVRVARQIERAFPKDKILELYLNHIYLGEGTYGIDAAAREYFGKPASRLSIGEAAVLGGLPVSPSRINPREDREAATRRRNIVLTQMAKAGFITQEQARAAIAEPIRLARRGRTGPKVAGAWFVERVRRELGDVMSQVDVTAGLRVFTTYDPVAQKAAEDEVARQATAIESGGFGAYRHPTYASKKGEIEEGQTQYLQAAAVVMDARTGEVRALVGGRDYEDSPFDRVFQAVRQPGSAFKPFVYLTALEKGTPPTQIFQDQPVTIQIGGRSWTPKNYTGTYDGPITMRDALARSKNTVTVQVAQQVGIADVIRTARDMGISTPIPDVPATALGAAEVKPIELVRAFAAFDNGGALVTPHFVKRVEDGSGNVIWEADPAESTVLQPEEAFVLTSMLRDVVDRGTATTVRAAGFRGPAAGKTGTTNGATDVWFVGYTPDLVASVWFGFDKPETIVNNASGGSIAGPVWARIMSRIYQNRRMPAAWTPPSGVVTAQVDRRTGLAMDASCPGGSGQAYTEYFVHSAPVRQACYPAAPYPQMAGDSIWTDEEAGAYAYQDTVGMGMTDLEQRGIKWPELEAQRRRQGGGAPPATPLPGSVEDPYATAPAGSGSPPPARSGDSRRRTPVTPPAEPPVASDGQDGTSRRQPRVIGEPVGGDGASSGTSSGSTSGSSGGSTGTGTTGGSAPPAQGDTTGGA